MLTIEGNIINIGQTFRGRIEIGSDGLISSVGPETGKADIVLKDELIFPGFIDLHVHARECAGHSQDYKEDFITAGQAAINGGVVAFADMPNNPVPPVDDESYKEKRKLTEKCPVDVLLYAGISPKTGPLSIRVPYKAYISKSVGDLFFNSFDELDQVLEKYRGQSVSFHCEDPEILRQNREQISHELQRPPQAEISAIEFALQMIGKYNLKGKICHCSTAKGLERVMRAREEHMLNVTVEVTPHHLYFDGSMVTEANKKMFQVNPPIRQTPENRLALIEALRNGQIDYLATDHAPHTMDEKQKGASGLAHLDTYGPFAAWLIKEHNFTPHRIMQICSLNPAAFLNDYLGNSYGKIDAGFAGSLTVMDMGKPVKIEKSLLKTKAGWSPFEGITFPGSAAYTIIKGKVYQNS